MTTFRLVIFYHYCFWSSFQLKQWCQQLNSTGANACCSSYYNSSFLDRLPSVSNWDAVVRKSLISENICAAFWPKFRSAGSKTVQFWILFSLSGHAYDISKAANSAPSSACFGRPTQVHTWCWNSGWDFPCSFISSTVVRVVQVWSFKIFSSPCGMCCIMLQITSLEVFTLMNIHPSAFTYSKAEKGLGRAEDLSPSLPVTSCSKSNISNGLCWNLWCRARTDMVPWVSTTVCSSL